MIDVALIFRGDYFFREGFKLITSISFRCSSIDGKPIGTSPAHRMICGLLDRVTARALCYEHEVKLHPPPEVLTHDRSIDLDMGRTRQYQLYSRGGVSSQTGNPVSIQTSEAG